MKVSVVSLIVAAGAATAVACAARADEPGVLGGEYYQPARIAGYIYINAATGERRVTPVHGSRLGDPVWENLDTAGSCNFFYGLSRPSELCDLLPCPEPRAVHWGDIAGGIGIAAYEAAYATNIGCDTAGSGVIGLDMINVFVDDYDGVLDPGGTGAGLLAGFMIEDLSGGDCTLGTSLFAGWIFTVDLEGTGYEFNLGTADLDGDGFHDFGYSYSFVQGQSEPKGIVGPLLVRPFSLGGLGTAVGCPDLFDFFRDGFDDYAGSYWFGGGDCAAPRPYASFYMRLFADGGPCDPVDYNDDGIVDFSDYLEFLNRFDARDPSADLNQDGVVDFSDYLEFLNLYDACGA